MYNSPMASRHKTESTTRIVPKVYARFNLNRYSEYVLATDLDRAVDAASERKHPTDMGRRTYGKTDNVLGPFRYAHGVSYPIAGNKQTPFKIYDGKDSRFDRMIPLIPSDKNSYLYYTSSNISSETQTDTLGYKADKVLNKINNAIADITIQYCYPKLDMTDPYFLLQEQEFSPVKDDNSLPDLLNVPTGLGTEQVSPTYLHGNAIDFRFNTIQSSPRNFKVKVAYRDYGVSGTRKETVIYDSILHGLPDISTGTIYRAKAISRVNNKAVISLYADVDSTAQDKAPVAITGPLDIVVGEELSIRKVHPSVDGIYKVISIDDVNKTVTIDSAGPASTFNIHNEDVPMTQVYSADPGKLTLFMPDNWNGSDAWTTIPKYWTEGSTNLIGINAIQLQVFSVSSKKSPVEIISIEPSLYADLTDNVVTFNINMDTGTNDAMFPVGQATSNTGSVTLSNDKGTFDSNNYLRYDDHNNIIGSPISNLLTDKVEFFIDGVQTSFTDNTSTTIRLATMVTSDSWQSQTRESTDVPLVDYAKILQERSAPDLLLRAQSWENDRRMLGNFNSSGDQTMSKTDILNAYKKSFGTNSGYSISGIIMTLLAASGWRKVLPPCESVYYLSRQQAVYEPTIRFFWSKKESSVWDVLSDFAQSTQTAIFFDRYGYLRIFPRDYATEYKRGVENNNMWRIMGKKRGEVYPDIITISKVKNVAINKVNITYNNISTAKEGNAANASFWEPADNTALRIAELKGGVKAGSKVIKIKPRSGSYFDYSGYVVFANNTVRYQASAFWLTRGVAKGSDSDTLWSKYWVKSREGLDQLKMLNDGYDPVPANELYVEAGLTGNEKGASITFPVPDVDVYEANDGWKIRYIIDGMKGDVGNIDGSQWRNYDYDAESWILSCKQSDFPKSITLAKNSKFTANDQFLVAYRNYDLDDMENIDRVISKFRFIQGSASTGSVGKNDACAGITLYNRMNGKKEKFYAVAVYMGDKKAGKGTEPRVTMYRVTDDSAADETDDKKKRTAIKADFVKNAGTSIDLKEWCILEVEVLKSTENGNNYDYEFAVYLNGFNVAHFTDTSKASLDPNVKAGFFVRNAVAELDSFAVVDEPKMVKPAKNKKQRHPLNDAMKRTHRKRSKAKKKNSKGSGNNGRGNNAKQPRGTNKSRRNNNTGGRKKKRG